MRNGMEHNGAFSICLHIFTVFFNHSLARMGFFIRDFGIILRGSFLTCLGSLPVNP